MSKDLKPMTAADYRANAEKVNAERPTEIVQLTSGSVFELRRPDLASYMMTGRLPKSLVNIGLKAWKKGVESITSDLSDEDAADMFIFMREIVHECTVKPKFVEFATNDDQIGASDMLKEDFTEIFRWAMTHMGVPGIRGLESFRDGSARGTSGNSADSKEQRSETEQSVEVAGAVQ